MTRILPPILVILLWSSVSWALSVPDDPSQSIRYWKPQVIPYDSDPSVTKAHQLFKQLLGAWDISRIEPTLNVVKDSSGPWAASLADGNILLSRAAIDICFQFGEQRGEHLLAFVLAHELAHQKGNDLWHQQFFRLIGNQSPAVTEQIKRDLKLDEQNISQIETLETQADLDAVVMMASVGYDPYQIVLDHDFYTAWVESIWKKPCRNSIKACSQAKERALRTQAQLESISDQSIFYELGIQALVSKQYAQARDYLTAYARNFPGRSVHNSIGASYLAEAISLWPQYSAQANLPNLYFPLFVEATPSWKGQKTSVKRGSSAQLKANIAVLAEQALSYFEKAQRLSPEHRETHYLRSMSYLLMGNSPMANGIIEGQYIPMFGRDNASDLLQALSYAISGKTNTAQNFLSKTIKRKIKNSPNKDLALLFAMAQNHAEMTTFHGQESETQKIWKSFAQSMSKKGEAYLFQLALSQLNPTVKNVSKTPPSYQGLSVREKYSDQVANKKLWFDGEPVHLYRDSGGTWLTNKEGNIIALWLNEANFDNMDRLKLGDSAERIIRVLGPADRRVSLRHGEYLAYDKQKFALRVHQNKITSWFLYPDL